MAVDESRILAEQRRPERVLYELGCGPAGDRPRIGVADARMARVGVDPDKEVLPSRQLARGDGGRFLDRHAGYHGANVGNVHDGSSSGSDSPNPLVESGS